MGRLLDPSDFVIPLEEIQALWMCRGGCRWLETYSHQRFLAYQEILSRMQICCIKLHSTR